MGEEGTELWNPVSDRLTISIMGDCNMTVSSVLSNLSKTWKTVEAIAASFSNLPDGDYIGDLKEMKLGTAKKGRTQVVVDWEVADGELAGKTQKQFYGLSDDKGIADPTGMGYWKNVCEVIGMDLPEDLNLWQETMDEFVGNSVALYDITAKANGNYTNVFVNGVSEYTKGTGEEQPEEVAGEEAAGEELEVVEEVVEEVQEVVVPTRKALAKPVVVRPVAKVAAQPAKKVVAAAQPVRKIVTLNRK
jgi:hypothetical protein